MYPWFLFAIVILLQIEVNEGCVSWGKSPYSWPRGKYILLKPRLTGCPDGLDDEGYLYQDTIDKNPSNNRSETLHIDGEVACSHVKRYFCSKKYRDHGNDWPSGQYCVHWNVQNETFGPGMRFGRILMYGEKKNKDKYNFTKFRMDIKKSRAGSEYTGLYFACRTTGNKKTPIKLPSEKPFYLLPYGSRDCQQVEDMVATSEWIKYHTDNYDTRGDKQTYGAVPYHELGDRNHTGITMYYCYYKRCIYFLNDTKGVVQFSSFPGKMCIWWIMVPDNHTLHLHFTNFSLSENDTLRYSKKTNGRFRSSNTINVSMVVPFTLSADSDVEIFFTSDKSNSKSGFRAEYRVFSLYGE